MRITKASAFLLGFYLVLVAWWFASSFWYGREATDSFTKFFAGIKETPANFSFAFLYGLIPIFGGVMGFMKAEKWGLTKSKMGKALMFLSLGLITWGYGEMIWSYYNFVLKTEVPYPSWADASFIISWPLWSIGVIYLSFATGASFALKKRAGQLLLISIPIVAIALSYYLLVGVARQGSFEIAGGPLKVFFDLAYPIWDVVILTLAFLVYGLSFKYLGGRFKWPVLITLFGFVINYFADFGFSYTTTVETFYNGGWVDLLFASAMFVLSFGVNSFDIKEA